MGLVTKKKRERESEQITRFKGQNKEEEPYFSPLLSFVQSVWPWERVNVWQCRRGPVLPIFPHIEALPRRVDCYYQWSSSFFARLHKNVFIRERMNMSNWYWKRPPGEAKGRRRKRMRKHFMTFFVVQSPPR